jgi:hypothetical protein
MTHSSQQRGSWCDAASEIGSDRNYPSERCGTPQSQRQQASTAPADRRTFRTATFTATIKPCGLKTLRAWVVDRVALWAFIMKLVFHGMKPVFTREANFEKDGKTWLDRAWPSCRRLDRTATDIRFGCFLKRIRPLLKSACANRASLREIRRRSS